MAASKYGRVVAWESAESYWGKPKNACPIWVQEYAVTRRFIAPGLVISEEKEILKDVQLVFNYEMRIGYRRPTMTKLLSKALSLYLGIPEDEHPRIMREIFRVVDDTGSGKYIIVCLEVVTDVHVNNLDISADLWQESVEDSYRAKLIPASKLAIEALDKFTTLKQLVDEEEEDCYSSGSQKQCAICKEPLFVVAAEQQVEEEIDEQEQGLLCVDYDPDHPNDLASFCLDLDHDLDDPNLCLDLDHDLDGFDYWIPDQLQQGGDDEYLQCPTIKCKRGHSDDDAPQSPAKKIKTTDIDLASFCLDLDHDLDDPNLCLDLDHDLDGFDYRIPDQLQQGGDDEYLQSPTRKRKRGHSDDDAPQCPAKKIKTTDIDLITTITRLPCLHLYHTDCIVPWLEINHLCPLCRFSV